MKGELAGPDGNKNEDKRARPDEEMTEDELAGTDGDVTKEVRGEDENKVRRSQERSHD